MPQVIYLVLIPICYFLVNCQQKGTVSFKMSIKNHRDFKIIKTHIIRYKKLDIMRFILEHISKFPTQIKF